MGRNSKSGKPASHFRTICYIDGFNLYYGLRDAGYRRYYWLNVREMAASLMLPRQRLAATKYFTARISGAHPGDSSDKALKREASRKRQTAFLDAIGSLNAVEIYEGQFILSRKYCRSCSADFWLPEEKATDVQIATTILSDAFLDRFDNAIIVSADSDLVPPIRAVSEIFPHKKVSVYFPPKRFSSQLQNTAWQCRHINESMLKHCQLPETIALPGGVSLTKPDEWFV